MRLRRPDFAGKQKRPSNDWYDLYEDWDLIDASFTAQYGIRLRNEPDMSWGEFCTLLSGIMPETPLGQIVSIRSENDKEILKHFTPEQHRIRNEWRSRRAREMIQDPETAASMVKAFQEACKQAFGKKQETSPSR
jgi:hypothetical protein